MQTNWNRPEATLTDISDYLTKHDSTLAQSFKEANEQLKALRQEISDLKVDFEKTFVKNKGGKDYLGKFNICLSNVDEFIFKHDRNLLNIRQVMKNLFDITETVALKEINTDAKGFIRRETLNRLSKRPEYNESILKPDKLEDC